MNASYSLAQGTERTSPIETNWIQTQLRIAPKRFVLVTVSAFAVGATIGTTLAIALDLPPVLRVCQAMRSIKK